MDCIFCKIAKNEIPSEDGIFEDEEIKVFRDIHPKAPVHLLIIPKKHIASVQDFTREESPLIARLILTAQEIAKRHGLKGYKLVFNVGREGGQVIDHVHLHLLGGEIHKGTLDTIKV